MSTQFDINDLPIKIQGEERPMPEQVEVKALYLKDGKVMEFPSSNLHWGDPLNDNTYGLLNALRVQLIDKKYAEGLTADEERDLNHVQLRCDEYINSRFLLPAKDQLTTAAQVEEAIRNGYNPSSWDFVMDAYKEAGIDTRPLRERMKSAGLIPPEPICSSCKTPYKNGYCNCACKLKAAAIIAFVSSMITASVIFFALHFKWLLLTK